VRGFSNQHRINGEKERIGISEKMGSLPFFPKWENIVKWMKSQQEKKVLRNPSVTGGSRKV
jgi:hypothetical protein